MIKLILKEIIVILVFIGLINCHGRMDNPPSRNSAWRFLPGFPQDREDYNLAHSFGLAICGSIAHQYGGMYATGKIVKSYSQGDIISIHTYLWINHAGPIQMSICPVPNEFSNVEATQACFDKYKLEVVNSSLVGSDIYKAKLAGNEKDFYHSVKLPDNLSCAHCVLQWKWFAVNTGEVFTNCADIEIKAKAAQATTTTTTTTTRSSSSTLTRRTISSTTTTSTTTSTQALAQTSTIRSSVKFACSKAVPPPKTPRNDLYMYTGSAVICFWVDKTSPADCEYCKMGCLTDIYECPTECDCRWYA